MTDELEFPRLVYQCPGPYQRKGGTFDYLGVANEQERAIALKKGWFDTIPEAIEAASSEKVPTPTPPQKPPAKSSGKITPPWG